jgi:HPt (histidine-containing phosphotransfer) domain-containing protein
VLRALHTLKGNAATFGVTSVADAAHRLESKLLGSAALPEAGDLAELLAAYATFAERLGRLLGTASEPVVELAVPELEALIGAAESGAPAPQLSGMLARLRLERAPVRLRRIGDQARSLAERLGKARSASRCRPRVTCASSASAGRRSGPPSCIRCAMRSTTASNPPTSAWPPASRP